MSNHPTGRRLVQDGTLAAHETRPSVEGHAMTSMKQDLPRELQPPRSPKGDSDND